MVQQFTAWMPELAFNTVRMRQLLQKYKDFCWGYEEEEEFQAVKVRMCMEKCIQLHTGTNLSNVGVFTKLRLKRMIIEGAVV